MATQQSIGNPEQTLADALAHLPLSDRVEWCISAVGELRDEAGKFCALAEAIRYRLAPTVEGDSADYCSWAIADVLTDAISDIGTHSRVIEMLQAIRTAIAPATDAAA